MELRVAVDEAFDLAEGPFWDPIRERVLWVDIRAGRVLFGRLEPDGTIAVEERVQFPGTVGAVAVSEAGDWVVPGTEGLLVRRADGSIADGPRILPPGSGRRLNDGKPDPAGRYLVGSCTDDDSPSSSETLVQAGAEGVRELDGDLTLSNGLGWSPDGRRMYSIDTLTRRIFARDYDPATGAAGPREVLAEIEGGHPDGMCVDAEGHLWVAMWGPGEVRRIAPDGRTVRVIPVPAPHVTCVAFAGPDLGTLVITTATKDLDAAALARSPLAGRLFTADVGVRGLPQALWDGRPA